jgi:hypothetical protein
MNRRIYQLVGVFVLGSVLLFSCEKDKKDAAPQLPPVTAFAINTDEFNVSKSTGSYDNFGAAVTAVGYWNSVLYANLAVPVAAYAEAFNHAAERVDNTTWKWAYDVEGPDATYSAELFAEVIKDSIYLEMHISKSEGFQDFVWFTGKCDIVRSTGEWSVFTNPDSNVPWVFIEWNHDWEAKTFDVRYTNVYEGNEYIDSYIEYGLTTDPLFNAYYIIYDSMNDNDYEIDLNTANHNGRVYYDGLWHCWDTNYMDIPCEE